MTSTIPINCNNFFDYSYLTPYIRYIAEDKYREPWELINREVGDYEFIFITKGTGQFCIDNRIYNIKVNDLILLKPNIFHEARSLTATFEFICIHFDIYVSQKMNVSIDGWNYNYETLPPKSMDLCKVDFDFPEYLSIKDSSDILLLLKKIQLEKSEKRAGYSMVIKAHFIEFLVNIIRQVSQEKVNVYPKEIEGIIEYIRVNYMNKIRLSDLSSYVHLEATYICSLFKKSTGYTISEFLKKHRLSLAKELLLNTDIKLDEISSLIGYYDMHHFSKVFKAEEGIAPSQFRQIKRYL